MFVSVGIDIGTTSVKALAVDPDGNVLARARVPHDLRVPAPDRLEHDAAQAWRRGPRKALAALGLDSFDAVAVAAMVPSFTAVRPRGVPRAPGLLYGDVRGGAAPGGAHPGASGEATGFLRWLASEVPDAAGYWPAQALANYSLASAAVIDAASAASLYPLFNGTEWDASLLAEVGAAPTQMPRVAGIGEAVGTVAGAGAVLASGLVDAIGEQMVSGVEAEGDVLVVLGTTLLVWALVPEWREVPGLWTIPHTVPGTFLVGGASNAGGLFLEWVRRLTQRPRATPAPFDVPVWEPYPRGERTPLHDPSRRAALHGLDLTHGPTALLRAAYESAGFVVRQHLEIAGIGARRLVVSGGGARDPLWLQALADATELPVDVVAVPEGGALGAAFVARLAAGAETDFAHAIRWARTSHRVEPDPVWVGPTGERYERFRALSGVE